MRKFPPTSLLLGLLSLGLVAAPIMAQTPPDATKSSAQPAEDAGSIKPEMSVGADNSARLTLSMNEAPPQLFEEVRFSPAGTPQSETDFRYAKSGGAAGRLVSSFDPNGRLTKQDFFDGANRLVGSARLIAPPGKAAFMAVAPAKSAKNAPRATQLKVGAAVFATYLYDRAGHLTGSRHAAPANISGATVEYFFAPDGRPTRKVLRLPKGVTATATYDARGKRSAQKIFKPGKVTLNISYRYNARGLLQEAQMSGMQEVEKKSINARATFLYDKAGRFREQAFYSGGVLMARSVTERDAKGEPNASTIFSYRDGKLESTMKVGDPDKNTAEFSRYDAAARCSNAKLSAASTTSRRFCSAKKCACRTAANSSPRFILMAGLPPRPLSAPTALSLPAKSSTTTVRESKMPRRKNLRRPRKIPRVLARVLGGFFVSATRRRCVKIGRIYGKDNIRNRVAR